MATDVHECKLDNIKKKLPRGWSSKLGKDYGVTRQYISWVFYNEKFNHPAWSQINQWAKEYDEREKQSKELSQSVNN